MKTNWFLSFIIFLAFALSWNAEATVTSECNTTADCFWDSYGASGGYNQSCSDNVIYRNFTKYYVCNLTTEYCQYSGGSGIEVVDNCSGTYVHCFNGDLYSEYACEYSATFNNYFCGFANRTQVNLGPAPECDNCNACYDVASAMYNPQSNISDVTYNVNFDKSNTIDDGDYVLVPGTAMNITDISEIKWECNCGVVNNTAPLYVWVYNATNNEKLATSYNSVAINSSIDRDNVIGDSSSTCGQSISEWANYSFDYGYSRTETIYTFAHPFNYTVFIDVITAMCTDNANGTMPYPFQYYVCPWLGGTARSNQCFDSEKNPVDGWTPKENFTVLVPGPDISIYAPPGEPDVKASIVPKEWIINNTGQGKVNMSIKLDCGGWTCVFDSNYTTGQQIQLDEGELYNVPINVTTNPAQPIHQVGIIVTYGAGYYFPPGTGDLLDIMNKNKTSYITFGAPIIT